MVPAEALERRRTGLPRVEKSDPQCALGGRRRWASRGRSRPPPCPLTAGARRPSRPGEIRANTRAMPSLAAPRASNLSCVVARAAFFTLAAVAVLGCDKAPPVALASTWTTADHDRVPGETAELGNPQEGSAVPVEELVWAKSCTPCHGPNGQGMGTAKVPDFTSRAWHSSRTDAALTASILNGGDGMPKFSLPASVVASLVRKVRAFAAAPVAVPGPVPSPAPSR